MATLASQLVGSRLLPSPRAAGISLMAGVVLTILPSLLTPGGALIKPVDPTDFAGSLEVLSLHPNLAHLMTLVTVLSLFLYGYGLLGLLGLPGTGDNRRSALLQYGIMTSMFGWGVLIVAMGMRHMTIHLMQRSVEAAGNPTAQAQLMDLALAGYTGMAGLALAFLSIYPFASMLAGVGLAQRFKSLNIYKIASIGLAVVGAGGLLNFLIAQHFPEYNLTTLVYISNTLLSIGGVCFFIVGLGMYRGRQELVHHEAAD